MADTTIVLKGHLSSEGVAHTEQAADLIRLSDLLRKLACGATGATKVEHLATATAATGTLTLSGASGTVGGTINGTLVTVAFATSDANTASLLAAAINAAAAIVSEHVEASAALGVVTLTSRVSGHAGNAVTLAASGTGVTASGARLTGGTHTRSTHQL